MIYHLNNQTLSKSSARNLIQNDVSSQSVDSICSILFEANHAVAELSDKPRTPATFAVWPILYYSQTQTNTVTLMDSC